MLIRKMLEVGNANAIALTAPSRLPLTYEGLRSHCVNIGEQLGALGLQSGDRAAIVLQNGPEMASCFLAVASTFSAAPLNPAYKQSEYHFYLKDLAPKIEIVEEGSKNPVRAAAK